MGMIDGATNGIRQRGFFFCTLVWLLRVDLGMISTETYSSQ